MIIDAHYHLEERLQDVDGLLAQMNRYSISRVALIAPGVGPLELMGIRGTLAGLLPRLLTGPWRQVGMFFYRTTLTKTNRFSVLGRHYAIYDVPDNDGVARVIERYPDRFHGWVFVNPRTVDPSAELERWVRQPGWVGVKVLPFWHRYAIRMLDEVAAWCVEKDWPMLIHLGGDPETGDYRYLPERHPRLKVIYAHAGIPFYRQVWEYISDKDNLFVDLSNPIYVDGRTLLGAVKALGAQKCVHGTDGPYGHADPRTMMDRILRLPLSDGDKERALGGNFADLVNL